MRASSSAVSREEAGYEDHHVHLRPLWPKRSSSRTYDQAELENTSADLSFDGPRFPSGLLVTNDIPTTFKRYARE